MSQIAVRRHRLAAFSLVTVLLLMTALGGVQRVAAQQQGQLFISVLDASGKPVTDLEASEVSVKVDDTDCKILKLEPVSKPMKLTVMIDNGSATADALANLRSAVKGFIEAIPDDVQTELLTTAPQPRWLEKLTNDRDKLLKAVDRLAPDQGAALFFDALVEAGNRVEKDKSDYFPVFMMLASDVGRNSSAMDRDYQRLLKQIVQRSVTVHFILFHAGGERPGSVAGALQTEVGLAVTKLSGGRYENIAAHSRLATLMPELARQIAQSNARQTHQYRITYQLPNNSTASQRISAGISNLRIGVAPMLSIDGHMPVTGAP